MFKSAVPETARNQTEISRKLKGFLLSNQLAVPGQAYDDGTLASQFSAAPMPVPINLSNTVLSGNFRGLTNHVASPLETFDKTFLERSGVLAGVMMVSSCNSTATNVCAHDFDSWKASLQDIEGALKVSSLSIGGGPPGTPFAAKGTVREYVAYDDRWRISLSRVDMDGTTGPVTVMLVVASN